MSLKTKKIVFSSIALGLSVLSMILFVLPIYGGINPYVLTQLLSTLNTSNPEAIIGFLLCLFSLLSILLTAVMIALGILILLCDLSVIKVDKLRKGLKKALVIIGTFQIILVYITCTISISASFMDKLDIEFAGIIINLILALALRIMIRFVGRLEKVKEDNKEQSLQATPSLENKAADTVAEEPKEEEKSNVEETEEENKQETEEQNQE